MNSAQFVYIRSCKNPYKYGQKYKFYRTVIIAAIANCGGLLIPLGDPQLLMLYLR